MFYVGVKGYIRDQQNNIISGAEIWVAGREKHHVTSTSSGEFWRILLPGEYNLTVCYGVKIDFSVSGLPLECVSVWDHVFLRLQTTILSKDVSIF